MEALGSTAPVRQFVPQEGNTQAEMMKNIRKARLERQVLADPSLASKLVSLETTATYNAKGDLVQAVGGTLGEA